MWNTDTVDKIVTTYFASVTKSAFEYKGKVYEPTTLIVRPKVFCPTTCPPFCGGCCMKATLDYLPEEIEQVPDDYLPVIPQKRYVEFNGRTYSVYSDLQRDNETYWCRYRRPTDGRCDIHPHKPFAADFECVKFFQTKKEEGANQLTQLPFPRKWSYTRVDGKKGGLCESLPPSKDTAKEVAHKLGRLKKWAEHFQVDHTLDEIIEYVATGPHNYPLTVNGGIRSRYQNDLFIS